VALLLGFGAGLAAGFVCENPAVVITHKQAINNVLFMLLLFF
jgi:hypothetical protein